MSATPRPATVPAPPPRRSRRARARRLGLPALTLAAVLVGGVACSGSGSGTATGTTAAGSGGTSVAAPDLGAPAALQPFKACDELLSYVKQAASDRVGPYGLPGADRNLPGAMEDQATGSGPPTSVAPSAAPTSGANRSTNDSAAAPAEAAGGTAHSDTNVQEPGVDEPDTVKTDGSRLLTVRGNRLIEVDVRGPAPVTAGSIGLSGDGNAQILVDGDHVLVIDSGTDAVTSESTRRSGAASSREPVPGTGLTLIDIKDPAAMKVLQTVRLDGTFLSARMVDGQARVVTTSNPAALSFVYPSSSTAAAQNKALEANRRIIAESKIEDWLPSFTSTTADGRTGDPAPLLDCAKVNHPKAFSGFGTLSVVTVGVGTDRIDPADAVGVMADGQTVYASTDSLYVATPAYVDSPRPTGTSPSPTTVPRPPVSLTARTAIHKFGIIGRGPAVYRASGEVEGQVLNQYSMGEHEGAFHIATTTTNGSATTRCANCGGVETTVFILHEHDGALTITGSVGDMGHGERVKAVRFIGKEGYVVTFRQTDPLYTLDLANPAEPKVAGELKLLGYSAYLHPAGDGLLIGVGQDATAQGRSLGTKVSLFDVHDLAQPRELQSYVLWNSTSSIEQDFHAFLWWQPTTLAMIPVDRAYLGGPVPSCPAGADCANASPPATTAFTGAIGLRIEPTGIREVGRVVNPSGIVTPQDDCAGVTGCGCPPDAQCTGSATGTGSGQPVDCSTTSCSGTSGTTTTTGPVICGTVGPCRPAPTPRCSPSDVVGGRAGSCVPDGGTATIERSIVVGDTVYTLSENGLKASDLATLHEKYWLAFPR